MVMLRRNLGYKLISVLIAVLLYFIAKNTSNPAAVNDVYVLPDTVGTPPDLVVRIAPAGFTVPVSGSTAAVGTFKSEPVKATVDLSHARLGVNKLPVQYKLPSGGIDTTGWPIYTDVTLERRDRHFCRVEVQFDNQPPPGYAYGDPEATPKRVTVSGLASEVERVARVIAVLPKAQGSWNIDQTVDLVAQDERQQTIDSVDVEPSKVHVEIILKRAEVSKSVLLSAQMIGSPAAGYVVTGYQFQPSMVTINGTQEALRAISSITVPIQIDPELKQGFDHMVQITAPPGTSLNPADAADIHVRVDVSPISNAQATPAPATAPTPAAIPNAAPPVPPQTTPVPTGKEPK